MTHPMPEPLSQEIVNSLLEIISPGSKSVSVTTADGSFSNFTHIVEARTKDEQPYKVVVRRYKVFGDYDRGEKARREFKTFELLNQQQVPAPEALYLDDTGAVLGIPGIVTRFVPGSLLLDAPPNPIDWARKLARTLAQIHAIPCDADVQAFLLKGDSEASWFLRSDEPPRYMQEYPGGSELWYFLQEWYPKRREVPPVLLHIDYWSGNILWHKDEISAVIDWEEAAYGDPAVDVGYARMNMHLMGLPEAADEFLGVYEAETGRKLENVAIWELAACARPMIDPADWRIDVSPGKDIFRKFIEDAKKRVNLSLRGGR